MAGRGGVVVYLIRGIGVFEGLKIAGEVDFAILGEDGIGLGVVVDGGVELLAIVCFLAEACSTLLDEPLRLSDQS